MKAKTLAAAVFGLAIAAPLSALEGVIVEDHSGEPLVSARVRVRATSGEVVADRDTDRAGRFATPPLDPGLYRVEAAKPNYLPAWLEVTVPAKAVQLRLARLGVISGRASSTRPGARSSRPSSSR